MSYKTLQSNVSTIVRGFAGGGSSNFSQRKYTRMVLTTNVISLGFSKWEQGELGINITFSSNDAVRILPHENDPMVITVQHGNWDIK